MKAKIFLLVTGMLIAVTGAYPQAGQWASRWAAENDPAAKYMIDRERQWAEAGCTQQSGAESAVAEFIADDYQGTAPNGERHNKADVVRAGGSLERECHLDDAKVRFFGDKIALVYGSERAIRKPKDGPEKLRCLVWTDTWLKRDNKWQIVAAQDTEVPCK